MIVPVFLSLMFRVGGMNKMATNHPFTQNALFELKDGNWIAKDPNGGTLKIPESLLVKKTFANTYLIRAGGMEFRYFPNTNRVNLTFLEGDSVTYTLRWVYGNRMSDGMLLNLTKNGDETNVLAWFRTSRGGGEYFLIERM